jgi:signal transduction histidine kinase
MRILVIEDERDIRRVLQQILELNSYEVTEAATGPEGLRSVTEQPPDLIICDVALPGMDGFAVLRELRKNPATESIPVIFLTARAERENIRLGMNLGAEDYLTKPFAADELLHSVAARLQRRATIEARIQQEMDGLRLSFTQSLPHELLTPLSAILALAALLEKEADSISRSQLRELSRLIRESAERQQQLINRLLTFAALELAVRDPARIADFAQHVTPSARTAIEPAVRLVAKKAGRLEDLRLNLADAALAMEDRWLTLLATELCDNALKFSAPKQPVLLTTQVAGNQLLITVQDQGRGMSAEQVAAISAYRQFDRPRHAQKGLGLGLALIRQVIELHQGHLAITSQPQGGTTVVVRLPLAPKL